MKFGFRTPSPKRTLKAMTTGRAKRTMKRAIDPTYGKKGMGWVKDPKKAAYNKVYNKTTIGAKDVMPDSGSKNEGSSEDSDFTFTFWFYVITIAIMLGFFVSCTSCHGG